MIEAIDIGLPTPNQPFSWATRAGDMIFSTQGPVLPDGTILQDAIAAQTRLTLENLRRSMEVAGATLADVAALQIFLVDGADMAAVDAVYRTFFKAPYPTRASLIVAGLVAPGMRIEICATAVAPLR